MSSVHPLPDRQPLLEDHHYFDEILEDNLVPPDPLAAGSDQPTIIVGNQQDQEEEELHDDEEKGAPPSRCIEKLGFFIGMIIGVTVQLSALAGNFVNVTVWGTESGPYASTTFVVWCCFMSSMFFVAFGLLRCLVQMSLQMASKMEKDKSALVVDIPSDNPLPNPSTFPSLQSNSSRRDSISTATPQDQEEILDDVMWHMKLHYVLGINVGISISWIATNLALGDQRVSLVFALAPPLLGLAWFWWMKQDRMHLKELVTRREVEETFDPLPTLDESDVV